MKKMSKCKLWLVVSVIVIIGLVIVTCDGSEPSPGFGSNNDPILTGTVSITGAAHVGKTLTANTSNLNGNGTISYYWKRNGTISIGSNSSTYLIQAADEGRYITVTVTRAGYSGSISSTATDIVDTVPVLQGSVEIIGDATVGQTLEVNVDNLEGAGDISYQWKRGNTSTIDGTNITDAIASTYTLVAADEGRYITVTVTCEDNSGSVTSSPTSAVAPAPALTGTVSITGTAKIGQTLTANVDSLGGSGTIFYQWKQTGAGGNTYTDISGANESTYLLTTSDYNRLFTVVVTRGGNSGSITSTATSRVADIMTWVQVSQSVFSSSTIINSIAGSSNRWVAVGGAIIASSEDGLNWSTDDYVNFSGTTFNSVAREGNEWIAVGSGGRMYTSTTGNKPWTQVNVSNIFDNGGALLSIEDIAYGNGAWIVVGSGKMGIKGLDFNNWTSVTSPLMTTTDVYYSLGDWVILGLRNMVTSDASGLTMQTGENWKSVDVSSVFSGSGDAIQTVAKGNGCWITAGNRGKMAISSSGSLTSGNVWTLIPNNPFGTGTIRALVYANNKWVAVGSESYDTWGGDTGNRIAISTDGINWTSVANTGFASNQQIYAVAFANGKWIAVGAGGRIAYAIDN